MNTENQSGQSGKQVGVDVDTYDRGIIPAETAARMEREGDAFKTLPTKKRQESAKTDDQTESSSIDVAGGYTVDKEGLSNNYAIEPEMYINEPGDLKEQEEELAAERAQELQGLQQDEEGKLTNQGDTRGKGPGII